VQALLAPAWPNSALTPFLEWSESDVRAFQGNAPHWVARIVTTAVALVTVLYAAALVEQKWLVLALVASLASGLLLALPARRAIDRAAGRAGPVQSFAGMLKTIEDATFTSDKLVALQNSLRDQSAMASQAFSLLRRLLAFAEVKYSPMMYAALQLTVLWDVHLVQKLEQWRREHGSHVRRWLALLGEVEALCALAVLRRSNPAWCFPVVSRPDALDTLSGVDVAHPLLPHEGRVGNDVSVGGPGSFLLVTGSNMSGKSTLLRSIAVNTVLAQMGAPVCAREFHLPSVVLATSVQVQDSLEQGVSRFMAELLRLKEVLDVVRANAGESDPMPLYLLDEILQGTNTAERQEGARLVLSQLVGERCIGVVTTHDLALADSPELNAASHAVHFTEGVDERGGEVLLSFEYKLLPGKATSVNALKLLRAVGLGNEGVRG
jgi:DNA mismatch repair ATPase MutS